MAGLRYKQTKPHVWDCLAVENVRRGIWDTPWYVPSTEKPRYLDSLGRRTRYHFGPRRWIVLQCNSVNNPDTKGGCCKAEMLVREDYLLIDAPIGEVEAR